MEPAVFAGYVRERLGPHSDIAFTKRDMVCSVAVIGGAGGALWGMYSANSLRPMMEDSKLYSVLTGLALVVVLLLVSSAFTIWKMRKLSPLALMKKEDAD